MSISEINFLRMENEKLRQYIYLFKLETEFRQRIIEIKENFSNIDDAIHLVNPLKNRLDRIISEKTSLKEELQLK